MSNATLHPSFQYYTRQGGTWARPHVVGEDMTGVSVSEADKPLITNGTPGGYIGTNPEDPSDQWYINPTWFDKNYQLPTQPMQKA